tara:strand:+ start:34 stop:645 length:612 start_codon:yes stop_codon:yes gene_type:complete
MRNIVGGKIPTDIKKKLDDTDYSNSEMQQIQYDAMGDDDIKKYFPNANIITYPELKNIDSIEKLLPNNHDYVFILYLQSQSSGHWSILTNNNNCIEFMCSYGSSPSTPLKWTPENLRVSLGMNTPYLDILLNKTDKKVIYSPIDYQNNRDLKVSTCGRHNCFRLMTILKYDMALTDYYKMMKEIKEKMNMTYDDIVSEYIDIM